MTSGNIILLNGASSAGKTSILQALQDVLDAPYLNLGIDKFISTLPAADQERPLWDEGLGYTTSAETLDQPHGRGCQLISAMHHTIAATAQAGHHVIADHLLIKPSWVRECARLFADLPVWLVGVRCPLEILITSHQCTLDQAQAHVAAVHTPGVYDLEVDTSLLSPLECALQIKQRLQEGTPPTAMRWLKAWSDPAKHRGWLRQRASYNSIEGFATRGATT